ncbi:ATP-binding protein [Streptomyces sp. NPDC008313]|uniref:ATP-binding protein n=1 Tax=Streptomyces sp. NPDC008313 TaxID=3364826 RepID=UPI0036E5357B
MASVIPPAPLGTDAAEDRSGLRAATPWVTADAAAERRFRFELAAHPGAVSRARSLTRARLSGWAVCEDTCETAALVVSELVTNAIVHTASAHVVCELHDDDELVRIAVRDEGCAPGEPHPSPQRPEEEHGRGLLLVSAVCRAWGALETGPGLLVWAELPRTPQPYDAVGTAGTVDAGTWTGPGPGRDTGFGTGARLDLGWGAKKPPSEGGGSGQDTPRDAEAEWV